MNKIFLLVITITLGISEATISSPCQLDEWCQQNQVQNNRDSSPSFFEIETRANFGDIEAIYSLAQIYESRGFVENLCAADLDLNKVQTYNKEAIERYFQIAFKPEEPGRKSLLHLADIYSYGLLGIERDFKQGVKLYEVAFRYSKGYALLYLGQAYDYVCDFEENDHPYRTQNPLSLQPNYKEEFSEEPGICVKLWRLLISFFDEIWLSLSNFFSSSNSTKIEGPASSNATQNVFLSEGCDREKALKFYKEASNLGIKLAHSEFIRLSQNKTRKEGNNQEIRKFNCDNLIFDAIDNIPSALYQLAIFFEEKGNVRMAKKYYTLALARGSIEAENYFSNLNHNIKNKDL